MMLSNGLTHAVCNNKGYKERQAISHNTQIFKSLLTSTSQLNLDFMPQLPQESKGDER